jgi:hypothetical protein
MSDEFDRVCSPCDSVSSVIIASSVTISGAFDSLDCKLIARKGLSKSKSTLTPTPLPPMERGILIDEVPSK